MLLDKSYNLCFTIYAYNNLSFLHTNNVLHLYCYHFTVTSVMVKMVTFKLLIPQLIISIHALQLHVCQSRATSGPRARSAHEGLASGRPPCSAITLQSGPRKPSQTKAGFMSEITSRECTNIEHFGRPREQRCTLRRLLIKYKNSKSRCRQTNSNNYNVGLGRFGQPSTSYAWRLWPFLKSLTCDATGRQSIEHQTSGWCLLRRGKTPSIDCQATCRKQLRSSASKLLMPTR